MHSIRLSHLSVFAGVAFKILILCWIVFLLPNKAVADSAGLKQTCRLISGKLASVSFEDCNSGGLVESGAFSVQGKPILLKEYHPLGSRLPRARVLVVGGTHGDEYSSISIVFKWMQILDIHHSGLFHWIFVPLLNPDGLLQERSTRTNASGVDLNRNMPSSLWFEMGYQQWFEVADRNPRYYPGHYPSSEPEASFLSELIHYFEPHAIISVHSPLGLVDYDGPGSPPESLGSLDLRRLGNFPGTLGNYAGVNKGIPLITLELPSSVRLPPDTEISSLWRDLVRWLIETVPVDTGGKGIWVEREDIELTREHFGK
ncbi:MAG: M14 family murein peptide amidase A [Syntrophales bacterium]|nr:M14 family murein peptide amidase A [Syntrophales bacterium]